jgi:arginine N-succinyltransferase
MSLPVQIRDAAATDLGALAALLGTVCALPRASDDSAHDRLLVATDSQGRVVASLRLAGPIGLRLPRYWYHVGCAVHAAPELGLFHRQPTLLQGNDLTGASELCDLAVDTTWADPAARLLALRALIEAALVVARARPEHFGSQLIAELPGLHDLTGCSPFWQGLGQHFYSGDPQLAAARHGAAWRSHVAALLPRQLLYTSFLPEAAQAAIGQAHPAAQALREALEAAGLRDQGYVRIDDAGPVLAVGLTRS